MLRASIIAGSITPYRVLLLINDHVATTCLAMRIRQEPLDNDNLSDRHSIFLIFEIILAEMNFSNKFFETISKVKNGESNALPSWLLINRRVSSIFLPLKL